MRWTEKITNEEVLNTFLLILLIRMKDAKKLELHCEYHKDLSNKTACHKVVTSKRTLCIK